MIQTLGWPQSTLVTGLHACTLCFSRPLALSVCLYHCAVTQILAIRIGCCSMLSYSALSKVLVCRSKLAKEYILYVA